MRGSGGRAETCGSDPRERRRDPTEVVAGGTASGGRAAQGVWETAPALAAWLTW